MNRGDWGAVGSLVIRWVMIPVMAGALLNLCWTHYTVLYQQRAIDAMDSEIIHLKEQLASAEMALAVRELPDVMEGLESAGMGGERFR